ncbi:TrkH family potassium uptake protein [Azospirillum halopraeferens]|uniref:TrkH family potassium uptake protein n=1 Tax=Azospirillum halopraeferens TaxID=34010 RepID=UPI000411B313|nr:TrkH family potassium uptake protein [Azospirillum halopraeferens]
MNAEAVRPDGRGQRGFDLRPVLYIIGALVSVTAIAMLVPMIADVASRNPDWMVFAAASALTLFFGVLLMLTNRTPEMALNLRQAFLLTALSWLIIPAFASAPFMVSQIGLSPADAYFEAMSGLTTTGATVIVGLDSLPPGLLLWRSLLQWLGGIGIIAMGIAILPFLRVGGMQLFRSESSDRSDKVMPRAGDLAVAVAWVYLTLTLACLALLAVAGMSLFDALNHAMTAVATGGFSTRDASVGGWQNDWVEWILVVFMLLGGMPFVRFISVSRGDPAPLLRDTQVRWYVGFIAVVSMGLAMWLHGVGDIELHDAVRLATFNVVSVVTTTGYASADYSLWGPMPVMLFLILMTIGGCTGSTSGGLKIFRFEILFMVLRVQVLRLYSPHRIIPLRYNNKPVDADAMVSVMSFGFVYIALMFIVALILGALGLEFETAFSGAVSAVGNIGPALGPIIGPAGTFSPLPEAAKWVLSFTMLLGRLEFFTVLVLFSGAFWKQ